MESILFKSKKAQAGHAISWLHKFLILIIVIGGIVGIVSAHYSKQFDIRDVEASAIAEKIINCIAPQGLVGEFSEEAVKNCLNFDEKEIYLNISIDKETLIFGDEFLWTQCKLKEKKVKIKYPPVCLAEKYYILKDGEPKYLEMFIAVKKIEKNL